MMTVKRLTAEDQRMLWPDELWPQDIGALAVLDGRTLLDPDGRFQIGAVREVIAARLHLVPGSGICCMCRGQGCAARCGSMPPPSTCVTMWR